MQFGNEAHDMQAEAEVRRAGAAAACTAFAQADQRIKQAFGHRRRQQGAAVGHAEDRAMSVRAQFDGNPAGFRAERTRVVEQLVEGLCQQLGSAVERQRRGRQREAQFTRPAQLAIAFGATGHQCAQVEVFAFCRCDGALDPTGFAHRAHDAAQSIGTVTRALQIRVCASAGKR
jgi:hypothetical protein